MEEPIEQLSVELTATGPVLSHEPVAAPPGGPHAVLVRTELMGVCRSDLKELSGVRGGPSQFGHELVGRVVRSTTGRLPVGERVCLDPNVPVRRGTGFARWMWVTGAEDDVATALPVAPSGGSAQRLVFAEPAACAAHCLTMAVRHRGEEVRGRAVCVLGAGTAGVLIAGLAAAGGAVVSLRNREADRLDFLRERGVLRDEVDRPAPDGSQDVVVVATSFVFPDVLERALRLVRPGGLVMLYGGTRAGDRLDGLDCDLDAVRRGERSATALWHGQPVVVGGSYGTSTADFRLALTTLANGRGPGVERLVTGVVDLAELPGVLRSITTTRQLGKVLVRP
ncbi:alcohol dehydrogenase catalytic domain-containing protein [Umezawaea beigongshangensis]|uniref:alcohol dehydrogenase catalytic domain-containing protein n=1 Tax=Umezawaea beigongshangensis TaxID=2780383 RepID=UPI0018F26E93|nr:alcohol dehydrogenase catalytic domain-containing protein [Umezawaea beigongshangensis]